VLGTLQCSAVQYLCRGRRDLRGICGAAKGLGIYILNTNNNNVRPDLVLLAAVLVSATLTLVLFAAAAMVQHLSMPWQRLDQRRRP